METARRLRREKVKTAGLSRQFRVSAQHRGALPEGGVGKLMSNHWKHFMGYSLLYLGEQLALEEYL